MRQAGVADPMRYRVLKAVAIVMALLLMAPGVEILCNVAGGSRLPAPVGGGIDSGRLLRSGDPMAVLEQAEELASADGAEVPEPFMNEVGLLPAARDVRVDDTGSVVGYVVDGSADDVLDTLVGRMGERGWRAASLGGEEGATFVKADGTYRWALATCTQVDRSISVVVRCMGS